MIPWWRDWYEVNQREGCFVWILLHNYFFCEHVECSLQKLDLGWGKGENCASYAMVKIVKKKTEPINGFGI